MLAKYVVFSSYRKMHERINHRHSKPYIACLRAIVKSLSTAYFQQHERLITLTSRDRGFLTSIPLILSKTFHDASQCEEIDCKPNCRYKLHLPELCRIAKTAKTSTETPMFYTEATFVEYHRLLVNLLEHFKLYLCALVKDANRGKNCSGLTDNIRFFGTALHDMLSSEIMNRHMLNIEESLSQAMDEQKQEKDQKSAKVATTVGKASFSVAKFLSLNLTDKATKKTAVAKAGDGGEGDGASAEIEEEEEFDESIASVQLHAVEYDTSSGSGNLTLASHCSRWLRLMTTYFNAMDQLLSSGPAPPRLPKETTVQVIAVQHQGLTRMNWETCFSYLPDSETFPNGEELVESFKKFLKDHDGELHGLDTWFNPYTGTFRDDNFGGTTHCEAIATVLMNLQRQGVINLLPVCYPV